MKKLPLLLLTLGIALSAHGATPTSDHALHVTLQPDSQYQVTATVSTDDAMAPIAQLSGQQSPLQILDTNGNVLGTVPAQTLIDSLTGATGSVTRQITLPLHTGSTTVDGLVARVLDSPPLIQVGGITVSPESAARNGGAPVVKITHRGRTGLTFKLSGTATDDGVVARVEVTTNGHQKKAKGTNQWHSSSQLHVGKNRVVVRAFDSQNHVSAPKRLTVFVSS